MIDLISAKACRLGQWTSILIREESLLCVWGGGGALNREVP